MNKENKDKSWTKLVSRTQKLHEHITAAYRELYRLREEIDEAFGKTPEIIRMMKKQKVNR